MRFLYYSITASIAAQLVKAQNNLEHSPLPQHHPPLNICQVELELAGIHISSKVTCTQTCCNALKSIIHGGLSDGTSYDINGLCQALPNLDGGVCWGHIRNDIQDLTELVFSFVDDTKREQIEDLPLMSLYQTLENTCPLPVDMPDPMAESEPVLQDGGKWRWDYYKDTIAENKENGETKTGGYTLDKWMQGTGDYANMTPEQLDFENFIIAMGGRPQFKSAEEQANWEAHELVALTKIFNDRLANKQIDYGSKFFESLGLDGQKYQDAIERQQFDEYMKNVQNGYPHFTTQDEASAWYNGNQYQKLLDQ